MIEVLYRGDVYVIYLSKELFYEFKDNNPETKYRITKDGNGISVKLKFLSVYE